MTITPAWLDLDGAVNVRDLAGLPTADGRAVAPHRLVRADNLQGLSDADVRRLVDDVGVRTVVDLRTGVEVQAEGPGPLTREPAVDVRHLSLFPEAGGTTDVASAEDGTVVLPWQERELPASDDERRRGASGVYLAYLDDRPDSVIAALRAIAGSPGATVVHCAAGKDRTGVVVAFALAEVGVERDEIVADYERTAERIGAILARLRASTTYAGDLAGQVDEDRHRPRAETMRRLLDAVTEQYGGVPAWLRTHGWTDADGAALRAKLLA
ncbi:Protein tyrosine/serine phosphatase [Jatrophihabitans endophyticus]|uniref:Protein tyrosine/serine phosphatase n=1 Tax=Jatrophihabitans endophyticus TaxID=1206085 RepID=A0A1M5HMK3_9ACTN|nr:tyrosine-protein phosphatase [Jatrophihabitans endophyticus]SHG17183.1 Protein tyrosine/serine phosphatase [Jatrophihabitans endophyticus]